MEKVRKLLSQIRLTRGRSGRVTKIVVLSAIVLSIVALLTLRGTYLDTREKASALRAQAAELEQANSRLEKGIDEMGSVQSVERIAQEELGLVYPDTVVFDPVG